MTLGIHQPYFFPYLPYFQLIRAVDKFILLDDVNFIKKGYINRNETSGGRFTIPIKDVSQNRTIREHEVVEDDEWKGKFFAYLAHIYLDSPHFPTVRLMLERVILDAKNVSEMNYKSISEVCAYLDIRTQIIPTSSIYPKMGTGQHRILSICKAEKATRYINAVGGQELYDRELFRSQGVELKFLRGLKSYSMIDVMMRYSKDDIKQMLNEYELE